jgi:hypothetical protein
MQVDAERLRVLLDRSSKKLEPLSDPLLVDLGLHRWLRVEREEAYADWFQWVLRQAKTPGRVFQLFGCKPPEEISTGASLAITREFWVPHGHENQEGRLDIVISFDGQVALVVELKKGSADDADTGKHAGYRESHPGAKHLLIAASADGKDYGGFEFCSWARVCIRIRRLATDLITEGQVMAAAMTLAYAGAVEQNLLGFHAAVSDRVAYVNPRTEEYVRQFLDGSED